MPRIVTTRRALLLAALALATVGVPTRGLPGGKYANPQLLVETEELARMMSTPGVRIVDVRSGMRGSVTYRVGHVPGAALLDANDLDDPAANVEGLPIRPAAAEAMFGRLGIDQDTTVVAYDDGGSVLAARLFFVLDYYGHDRVRVLNGGLAKWRREGRPLESAAPTIAPRRFEPRPRREALATASDVRGESANPRRWPPGRRARSRRPRRPRARGRPGRRHSLSSRSARRRCGLPACPPCARALRSRRGTGGWRTCPRPSPEWGRRRLPGSARREGERGGP